MAGGNVSGGGIFFPKSISVTPRLLERWEYHSWYSANIFQFQTDLLFKWSLLGKKRGREGCGHWKENPFLPTRFMHHPTKKEGCTNFSLSVAVICFYDDGKSISTIKLFPCFFSRFLVLSLWILLQQPLVTKLDATCCTKVTIEDMS